MSSITAEPYTPSAPPESVASNLKKPGGTAAWCRGTGEILDSVQDKRRLWKRVLDDDLDGFCGSGWGDSPGIAFLRIRPERAVLHHELGFKGRREWRPTT